MRALVRRHGLPELQEAGLLLVELDAAGRDEGGGVLQRGGKRTRREGLEPLDLGEERHVRIRHLQAHRAGLELLEGDALGGPARAAAGGEDRLDRRLLVHLEVLGLVGRDPAHELAPDPELRAGLPHRVDGRLLELEERMERRRGEVGLLVPGGRRQDDVRPLDRCR